MDAENTAFIREFAACCGLLAGSLLIAAPVVFFKIKESIDIIDDLKFSDESVTEVVPGAVTATEPSDTKNVKEKEKEEEEPSV
jgi:hypothetical protein